MITQIDAAKNRENQDIQGFNSHRLKLILAMLAGVFLLYAVQNHLVTDAFIAALSLIFDKFNAKATGIFPDIALLVLAALTATGVHTLLKNHFYSVLTGILLAIFAAIAWGA
jgi:hypothetical protein